MNTSRKYKMNNGRTIGSAPGSPQGMVRLKSKECHGRCLLLIQTSSCAYCPCCLSRTTMVWLYTTKPPPPSKSGLAVWSMLPFTEVFFFLFLLLPTKPNLSLSLGLDRQYYPWYQSINTKFFFIITSQSHILSESG